MVSRSDYHILEHFKESFLAKIESQLLKNDDIDAATDKGQVLVLLFKSKLPQVTSSSMLVHMTDSTDNTACYITQIKDESKVHLMKCIAKQEKI